MRKFSKEFQRIVLFSFRFTSKYERKPALRVNGPSVPFPIVGALSSFIWDCAKRNERAKSGRPRTSLWAGAPLFSQMLIPKSLTKKNSSKMKKSVQSGVFFFTWFNVSSDSNSPRRRYKGAFNPVRFCHAPWKSLKRFFCSFRWNFSTSKRNRLTKSWH